MPLIRAIEFYSGIGGLHLALRRSGINAEVVQAFDWDPAATQVYAKNWGNVVKRVDIGRLTASELVACNASLWLLSPSCQPYTVLNPSAKGPDDPRAKSFLHLVEKVLPDLSEQGAHPQWILIENVAGFENSTTRQTLLKSMHTLGYKTEEFLLTPLQFSIPNSRLRYYMLARLRPPAAQGTRVLDIRRSIPGHGPDWADPRLTINQPSTTLCPELRCFMDDPVRSEEEDYWKAFAVPDKVLENKGVLFDIVLPSSRRTCCFTRGYTHMVEGTSILQMNESLDTTATFDAYAAIPAEITSRVGTLRDLRLRYFTPEELLRLFHFYPPGDGPLLDRVKEAAFQWPPDISQKTKYRLIGNSVNVKVVQKLLSYLVTEDVPPEHQTV